MIPARIPTSADSTDRRGLDTKHLLLQLENLKQLSITKQIEPRGYRFSEKVLEEDEIDFSPNLLKQTFEYYIKLAHVNNGYYHIATRLKKLYKLVTEEKSFEVALLPLEGNNHPLLFVTEILLAVLTKQDSFGQIKKYLEKIKSNFEIFVIVKKCVISFLFYLKHERTANIAAMFFSYFPTDFMSDIIDVYPQRKSLLAAATSISSHDNKACFHKIVALFNQHPSLVNTFQLLLSADFLQRPAQTAACLYAAGGINMEIDITYPDGLTLLDGAILNRDLVVALNLLKKNVVFNPEKSLNQLTEKNKKDKKILDLITPYLQQQQRLNALSEAAKVKLPGFSATPIKANKF